jgi:hypothetical protein
MTPDKALASTGKIMEDLGLKEKWDAVMNSANQLQIVRIKVEEFMESRVEWTDQDTKEAFDDAWDEFMTQLKHNPL